MRIRVIPSPFQKVEELLGFFAPAYEKLFYFPGDSADHLPAGTSLSNVEKSFIQSAVGDRISVWHLKTKKPRGRVIHCHGSGFNMSSHYPHVSWLPDQGYEVIMFDYPGYGESEGTPTRKSTVDAARTVISHFNGNTEDGSPVFVLGQSLGGNVASVALSDSDSSSGIRGVILDSMYSSFKALAAIKLKRKYLSMAPLLAKAASALISNTDSPLSRASKLKLPTLIIHSRNDDVVPYQESLNFYNRLENTDVEFWSHLNSGHTEVLQNNLEGYQQKMVNWMISKAQNQVIS